MTKLAWDQVGDRRYEMGVDRGVLFLSNGITLPWNGLKSVQEKTDREVKSFYIDGQKYLDRHVPGSYAATLEAFTYPDELDTLLGLSEFAPGVYLHDQSAGLFHLSYRTGIGDDLDPEAGYRIHIVYNVIAVPTDRNVPSIADTVNLTPFQWALSGTPSQLFGARPTSHLSIDTRLVDPDALEVIENTIYGTLHTDPYLPSLVNFLDMIAP
jgi:hypothetical protein